MSVCGEATLALDLARAGRLYTSVILHGGTVETRREAAQQLARALLCEEAEDARPCDACRHCRRISLDPEGSLFHPDLVPIARDLRTSTSTEAVKASLRSIQSSPFEARGQVVVVLDAESLSGGAANALLKSLEEPGLGAPRNFLLLASTAGALLPTLRSRSLSLYLGGSEASAGCRAEALELADRLEQALPVGVGAVSPSLIAGLAEAIGSGADWSDPRSEIPWAVVAAAFSELARRRAGEESVLRFLDLAHALLEAPGLRLRGIPPARIISGLFSRCLTGSGSRTTALL